MGFYNTASILDECCDRLNMDFTGCEELLYGSQKVPAYASVRDWFQSHGRGQVIDCQLVVSKRQRQT
eukprot:3269040-Amphidinium_carterae.1